MHYMTHSLDRNALCLLAILRQRPATGLSVLDKYAGPVDAGAARRLAGTVHVSDFGASDAAHLGKPVTAGGGILSALRAALPWLRC